MSRPYNRKTDPDRAMYREKNNIYLFFNDKENIETMLKFKSEKSLHEFIKTKKLKLNEVRIKTKLPKRESMYSGSMIRDTVNEHSQTLNGTCSKHYLTERS